MNEILKKIEQAENTCKIPSEVLEPAMQRYIGKLWESVECHNRNKESLQNMYDNIRVLSRFADICNAIHCRIALNNVSFKIYRLLTKE